jgi:paraquat-inducible protein A
MESAITCDTCGLLQRLSPLRPGWAARCARCRSLLERYPVDSLSRTAAFSLAALVLYVPANVYPLFRMNLYGAVSESTVWDGCVTLFLDGQWIVAAIVFFASIIVPLLKLLGLSFLSISVGVHARSLRRERTWVYRIIDRIGPWAMLDVFLLAVLVALVKLGDLATISPGPGLLAFSLVVVFTILASISFDPKLVWKDSSDSRA